MTYNWVLLHNSKTNKCCVNVYNLNYHTILFIYLLYDISLMLGCRLLVLKLLLHILRKPKFFMKDSLGGLDVTTEHSNLLCDSRVFSTIKQRLFSFGCIMYLCVMMKPFSCIWQYYLKFFILQQSTKKCCVKVYHTIVFNITLYVS